LNEFRKKENADLLATGHYARLKVENGRLELRQSRNVGKDQSYFLYALDRDILLHTTFPLGEYKKSDVRALAKNFGIHVADASESQDVCFILEKDYIGFLKKHLNEGRECGDVIDTCGNIIDTSGKVLGKHDGIFNYTIGQRKGLGLSGGPFFVCGINVDRNEVIVSSKEGVRSQTIHLTDVRFMNDEFCGDCLVQIRSTNSKKKARVAKSNGNYAVELYEPEYGVARGQHCVFYDDGVILGGGKIAA
jgi:tRNA-specific 2-thiouridylase